ncbi:MAG: hypothetical protein N2444_01060 [Methylocystis sp.]|nr:hypothetical protein [Methylocystis sp.]
MRRNFICSALLLATLTLAACDKCGGFEEIRYPTLPRACRGEAPAR